jgi:fibronectin-binding autotransporter adhesin
LIKRITFVAVLATLLSLNAFGAMRAWTGTTSNAWSLGSNWGGIAPVAGDDLVFQAGAANLATTNDLPAGTAFQSITFSAPVASIAGNAFTIGAGGVHADTGSNTTITAPVTLGGSQQWLNDGLAFTVGAVNLNGSTLTLNEPVGDTLLTGTVSGAGGLVKNGVGSVTLSGSNTFTGQVQVLAGRLYIPNGNALGFADDTPANGTVISAGGTLELGGFGYPAERIVVNGQGAGFNGAITLIGGNADLTGSVVLGTTVAMSVAAGGTLSFSGVVSGSGNFGMGGPGTFVLSNANTFTGAVVWGATGASTSTLKLGGSNALPPSVALNIGAGGVFDMNSKAQTIASLAGTGNLFFGIGTPADLTITAAASTYSGNMTGSGLILFTGGTQTFTGTNSFNGSMTIAGGSAVLVGGTFSAPITQTSGSLSAASSVNSGLLNLTAGSFRPGNGGTGISTNSGLTLAPAVTYMEIIGGVGPNQFSNVHVVGNVDLGGAAFQLTGAGGVVNGTQLVIIDNDNADPVIGVFAGLPEGATIPGGPGGFNYTITYAGGSGNDVVLTVSVGGPPPAATATSLISSVNPSTAGSSTTFTATVTSGTPGTPTGSVTFKDGAATIGSGPVAGGVATLTTSALTAGAHNITAVYGGDASFATSTSPVVVQTVNPAVVTPPVPVPVLDGRGLAALAILIVLIASLALKA